MNELRVARVLSAAAHPFVLVPLTILLATRNLRWAGIIAAVIILPLTLVLRRNVRRGVWSDFDVSRRDQRSGLYWVGIPLIVIAAFLIDAPPSFRRGMFTVAALLLVALAGNRFLKTSLHMLLGAYCAVILARVYPWSAAAMVPLLIALAWSRWRLERHTPAEIATGLLLGLAAGVFTVM
jgi:hypothetical protein